MNTVLNGLRARPGVLLLGDVVDNAITVRVQMTELWDALAVRCAPDTSVRALKEAALDAFMPVHQPTSDFVMKLRGFEVLDEAAPIVVAGARDGSTFLLSYRFRRPVR